MKEDDGPKESAKDAAADDGEDDGNFELFVKSISFDTTQDSLHAHFAEYGELTKCKLMKGIGFVEYGTKAEAKKAQVATDGSWLDNRQINVEFSGNKPQMGGPTSG